MKTVFRIIASIVVIMSTTIFLIDQSYAQQNMHALIFALIIFKVTDYL